ncbi:MAG: ABC transporter transmembrane domain-containing protein [Planctomycetaceae bacterium]
MAAPSSTPAFRRLCPSPLWRSRRGLLVIGWSLLAAVLLPLLVFVSALVVDLLVHRGTLIIHAADAETVRPLVMGTPHELPQLPATATVTLSNSGLLPTAVRVREKWWGGLIVNLYRRMPALHRNSTTLMVGVGVLLVAALLKIFAVSHVRMLSAQIAMEAASGLRRSIHRQALRLGPSDLDGAEQATAIELFTDAANNARRALSRWIAGVVRAPVEIILLLALLLLTDWRLALQCGIPVAMIGWVIAREKQRGVDRRVRADAEADADLRPLADGLRKTRLVRGYGMEDFEHLQFTSHLERYTAQMLRGRMGETWSLRMARCIGVLLLILILLLLGLRIVSSPVPVTVAAAWTVIASLAGLAYAITELLAVYKHREMAEGAAERVYRYLAAVPEVSQAVGAKFLNPVSQSVILEGVTYRRNGETLLDRVDLRLPARTTTALVSNDPLSARAIAFLLPRFIEPHSGRILFDSEDIAWATLESLRAETVYVSGEDPFFTGTVLENLICGETRYSHQEATEACKLAHAHKFITALPSGYETQLGEHGEQLTPGQAFRLGLARAVLRNPAAIVIEEPQARMDDDSKALIDDAYTRILKDRTILFLPRRLSTVKLCQQVVFLSRGQIEAVGPQAELVRKCEGYRHWEYVNFSQLSRANGH